MDKYEERKREYSFLRRAVRAKRKYVGKSRRSKVKGDVASKQQSNKQINLMVEFMKYVLFGNKYTKFIVRPVISG